MCQNLLFEFVRSLDVVELYEFVTTVWFVNTVWNIPIYNNVRSDKFLRVCRKPENNMCDWGMGSWAKLVWQSNKIFCTAPIISINEPDISSTRSVDCVRTPKLDIGAALSSCTPSKVRKPNSPPSGRTQRSKSLVFNSSPVTLKFGQEITSFLLCGKISWSTLFVVFFFWFILDARGNPRDFFRTAVAFAFTFTIYQRAKTKGS